jgi:phenylacetate-CoA ligase
VVTELINHGMPMLRYEVGDRGAPFDGDCACGRVLPLMAKLTGRTADFLVAADGSRVAGISLIENTLTRFEGIRQLQLVQNAPLRLDANVAPGPGWGDDVAAALVDELRRHLGADVEVGINLIDRIACEPSGKYRFSICRIARPGGS